MSFTQDASPIPQFYFFCFVRVAHSGSSTNSTFLGPPSIQDLNIRLASVYNYPQHTHFANRVQPPGKKILSINPGPSLGTKQKDWNGGGIFAPKRVEFLIFFFFVLDTDPSIKSQTWVSLVILATSAAPPVLSVLSTARRGTTHLPVEPWVFVAFAFWGGEG